MFTLENTTGFSANDISLLNQALRVLMELGLDEQNASAIVNNNWRESGNTVESLTQR